MNIIRDKMKDYEKLIKTEVQIPLNNGDIIKFAFQPQDLPHLLGLQYLVDIPYLFEYSEKRLSATELYERMLSKGENAIDPNEFEKSAYFARIYKERIQYFSASMVLDIIESKQIVKFLPDNIKAFKTKMNKIEYFFWKRFKNDKNQYGYFEIGFIATGRELDKNYPNTFFFRADDEYIRNQLQVLPFSIMKRKNNQTYFEVYWQQVWQGMVKNFHYKILMKSFGKNDGSLDLKEVIKSEDEDIQKHFELLQLDMLDRVYLPYMKKEFRWTNAEKRYILSKISESEQDYYPWQIKQFVNDIRQINKKN